MYQYGNNQLKLLLCEDNSFQRWGIANSFEVSGQYTFSIAGYWEGVLISLAGGNLGGV
jgi:hypothetical protein